VHPGSLPTNDPRAHPAYPGQSRSRPGHCPPPPTTTPIQTDTSAGPAQPAPAASARLRLGQTRAGRGRSGGPRRPPAIPAVRRPAHRRALRPHFGRTQRTRERTDTGRRTPDTGTLRRPHRTPDTGRDEKHVWTLDAGRGRGQGDEGTSGIRTSGATVPSDRALGHPTVFLWTAPAALGSPCRLGVEATFQHEIASRTTMQLLGRSPAKARPGALLSSDDYGSSVERTGKLHPL
jgi:hypothetical protein